MRTASPLGVISGAGERLSPAEYVRLARDLEGAPSFQELRTVRVAFLSSCTLQFVDPFLRVEGARRRLRLVTHFGPFGQLEQQVGDSGSALYAFDPQVLVCVMRPEDVNPDAYVRYYAESPGSRVVESVVDRLGECVAQFRERSRAPVLVANFAPPLHLPLGPFDANAADSLTHTLAHANAALRARVAEFPDAMIWDYAGLVRSEGTESWSDPRLWALARVPVAHSHQPRLARHLARTVAALVRPSAKCLVLDLDNTLWGGAIGDDGLEGIQLGDDYPGNVFKSFQRAALGLADRGILLAVASKNDLSVVEQAFREHPEMLIRLEHLAALRVNWNPKSESLRAIAEELNIGTDALVLFDDNPIERAEVAANAPDVLVVDVPSDPLGYERALHDSGFFDTIALSPEDRRRVQMYREDRAREVRRAAAQSVEDFLADLEMEAQVGPVDDGTLGRVAQLVGKTNQFNLTTRRHSLADIARMCGDPSYSVTALRLRDRFGDLGLIAVGILAFDGGRALIDSFVMSCRAMGRQAEIALAAAMTEIARAAGCGELVGVYLPTARNSIVAQLYPTLGFVPAGSLESGGTRFVLDLEGQTIEWPAVIARLNSANAPRVMREHPNSPLRSR